jgi:hypothetical protein
MDDAFYRVQAERCREAALHAESREDRHGLEQMARHYDLQARRERLAAAERRDGK